MLTDRWLKLRLGVEYWSDWQAFHSQSTCHHHIQLFLLVISTCLSWTCNTHGQQLEPQCHENENEGSGNFLDLFSVEQFGISTFFFPRELIVNAVESFNFISTTKIFNHKTPCNAMLNNPPTHTKLGRIRKIKNIRKHFYLSPVEGV